MTVPGLRPQLETTVFEPPVRWTERGRWGRVSADLTLVFASRPGGCRVTAEAHVSGAGPLGPVLTRLAPYAIRADLRRAARILSAAAAGQ